MKKIKIGVIALMFSGMSYSHSIDTVANMIAGKKYLEFNYSTSKVINKITKDNFEDITIKIKKNQILYLDLYDNCKCNSFQDISKLREMKIIYRNGEQNTNIYNSSDATYEFDGKEIKKIIVSKPIK